MALRRALSETARELVYYVLITTWIQDTRSWTKICKDRTQLIRLPETFRRPFTSDWIAWQKAVEDDWSVLLWGCLFQCSLKVAQDENKNKFAFLSKAFRDRLRTSQHSTAEWHNLRTLLCRNAFAWFIYFGFSCFGHSCFVDALFRGFVLLLVGCYASLMV